MSTFTSNIAGLLRPGLNGGFGIYNKQPNIIEQAFKKIKSNKNKEIYTMQSYLASAGVFAEGAVPPSSSMSQAFQPTITNLNIGTRTEITANAIEDNLYPELFPQITKSLHKSVQNGIMIVASNLFNNGFTTIGYDGVPIFSTSHPTVSGQLNANTTTAATNLTESSLADVMTQITYSFVDMQGNKDIHKPMKLMVSPDLEPIAMKLVGSKYEPGTPNNAISSVYGRLPQGYFVNPFLNENTWFVYSDVDGVIYQDRQDISPYVFEDPATRSVQIQGYARFGVGITDVISIFGVQGV